MEVFTTLRSHRLSVLEEGHLPVLTLPSYNPVSQSHRTGLARPTSFCGHRYNRTSSYITNEAQLTLAIGELQVQVNNKSLKFIG